MDYGSVNIYGNFCIKQIFKQWKQAFGPNKKKSRFYFRITKFIE